MKVINNVQWDEKGLVMTKNNLGSVFLLGCCEYNKGDGEKVAVFFTTENAFLFYDMEDEVLWSMSEMKNAYVAKGSPFQGGDFPEGFDEFRQVCSAMNDDGDDFVSEVNMEVLTYYGIGREDVAQDIVARLQSLAKFREEKDMLS